MLQCLFTLCNQVLKRNSGYLLSFSNQWIMGESEWIILNPTRTLTFSKEPLLIVISNFADCIMLRRSSYHFCIFQSATTSSILINFTTKNLVFELTGINNYSFQIWFFLFCCRVSELLNGKGAGKGTRYQAKVNNMANRAKCVELIEKYYENK